MEPPPAILKPSLSAVSIGTGGPFGVEEPIILMALRLLRAFLYWRSCARRS
jgi:H+/Cl- antiporter ClcA